MKQKSLSKVLTPLFLALAVVVSCFGGIFYFNSKSKNKEIYAEGEEITLPVVIGKTKLGNNNDIEAFIFNNGNDIVDVKKADNYIQSNLDGNLKNKEFMILDGQGEKKEFIFIGFNISALQKKENGTYDKAEEGDQSGNQSSFYTLQVNAYLNERSLKTNESIKDQDIDESKYYFHILNLTEDETNPYALRYSDGTLVPQNEIEGHYKFVFEYTEKENDDVKPKTSKTVEFFAFNKDTYLNDYTNATTFEENRTYYSDSYYEEVEETTQITNENVTNYYIKNGETYEPATSFDAENTYYAKIKSYEPSTDVTSENFSNYYVLTHTEPRVYNTEKIDRNIHGSNTQYSAQYNYFNYNNNNTTNYEYNKTTICNNLQFPTIDFDITKYALRYSKTLYGTKTTYEYVLDSKNENNEEYTLKYYINNVAQPGITVNGKIYSVKLNEIGEYDIEFNFVYEDLQYDSFSDTFKHNGYYTNSYSSKYIEDASFVKNENWDDLVGNQKLYIFGYQLMYSDYSNPQVSNNKEFTNGNDLFTDISFMQNEFLYIEATSSEVSTENYSDYYTYDENNHKYKKATEYDNEATYYSRIDFNNINISKENLPEKICSTNQAPVSLKYYANMTTFENATLSYYKYWESYQHFVDNENNDDQDIITNNTRFTKNGYYQIFIEYNFAEYNLVEYNKEENKDELNKNPSNIKHYQFFSFEINNSEPKLYVKTNEGTNIPTDTYTNKSVDISWEANTIFDIAPRIVIKKQSFADKKNTTGNWITIYDNNKASNNLYGLTYSPINEGEGQDKEKITISSEFNGYYIITINYGPGEQTLAKYRFNIDTEDINGILTKAILNSRIDETNKNIISTEDYIVDHEYVEPFDILNSAFMLDWTNKESGANINATYSFIPLEQNDDLVENNTNVLPNIDEIQESNKAAGINTHLNNSTKALSLYTNYELKTLNKNLSYQKPRFNPETKELENINSMKTNAGLYLFTLIDEAGNSAQKVVMIDNSTPSVYVYVNEQDDYQFANEEHIIATRNAIMIWGDNKAIQVDSELLDEINQWDIETNITPTGNQILVPISKAKFRCDGTFITESDNHRLFILEDKMYHAEITDISHKCLINEDNDNNTNKVFDNISKATLEMNSDNSLLMFYSVDKEELDNNTQLSSEHRVYSNQATNNDFVYFEWIQNNGEDFEVKDITYYFYPLTFEAPSTNSHYPFSPTPTKTESIDLVNATSSKVDENKDKKVMSGEINLEKDGSATVEGLYVVKREYLHNISSFVYEDGTESKDYSPRYYSFFVERNQVISRTLSNVLIGEKIGLNIGSNQNSPENYQKQFIGEDFLIDLNEDNIKFRTSKLPVEFINAITSLNKFDIANKKINESNKESIDTLIFNEGDNEIDTKLTIKKYIYENFRLQKPEVKYKKNKNDELYKSASELYLDENDIKSFKLDGFYRVTLKDNVVKNEEKSRNDKNDFVFTFQVSVPTPSANIIKYSQNDQGNYEYLYYPETEKDISTNNKNIIVGWNKPQSISGYDAEIDTKNFRVKLTLEDKNKNILLNVNNNKVNINGTYRDLIVVDMADNSQITKSFINPSWDYYIDFEDIFSILSNEYNSSSVKVDLTLHYYGQEEDYSKTIYSVTKTIVFDFDKPSHNYNRLIQSDGYLNYYNNFNELDFNNPESEVNFENYAFTVKGDFTFETKVFEQNSIFTNSNMDTNKMFIRKYSKYLNETAVNQQSLTPDDVRYDDRARYPNRYRFDENLEIDENKVYQEISEYYYNTEAGHNYNLNSILTAIYGYNEDIFDSYYEIIEIDYAGNYRVYTIYLPSEDKQVVSYLTNNSSEKQNIEMNSIDRYIADEEDNSISLIPANEILQGIENGAFNKIFSVSLDFDIDSLINQFITIKIVDISANTTKVLTLAPSTNLEELTQRLNQAISPFNEIKGNIYYITILTSRLDLLKVEHRKPSNDYPLYWFTDGTTGFDIEFYVDSQNENSSAYITQFNTYQAKDGVKNNEPEEQDSNRKTIISNIDEYFLSNDITEYNFKYSFRISGSSGSEYFIEFLDNFNRKRVIRKIIGVEDNQDKVIYSAPSENVQTKSAQINKGIGYENVAVQFTNQSVTLKWQSVLNSVKITKYQLNYISDKLTLSDLGEDGNFELDEGLIVKSTLSKGIWTYPLIQNEGETNIAYEVVFSSTQGNEIYYIAYDNSLAEVSIVNASDQSVKRKAENQQKYNFDRTVYLSLSQAGQHFPTLINIRREYLDQNNQTKIDFIGDVESGFVLEDIGKYIITCYNSLGTSIQFEINIETKVNNNYWVTYKINGIEAGRLKETNANIYASDYGTADNPITYVTIYDYEVKYNEANGYSKKEELITSESENHITTLYKIVQTLNDIEQPNAKYIQVSKIAKNSNFIRNYDNHFTINDKIISSNNPITVTQDQVTKAKTALIKLTHNYNLVPENSIILRYKFNGNFVKELYLNRLSEEQLKLALTMVDSGVYDFYFTDLAGNKQTFGNNDYFRMYLLCDVVFNVNSNQAVDNAVFNGPIKINLEQVNQFDNAHVTLQAKLNGIDIKIPKINNSFTFTDFGTYNISLVGKINGNVITTNYNFRIVNYNEAMATFEYVGLNNYEIVEVIKLDSKDSLIGDNITEYIKATTEVNHIRSLALSSLENGLGGSGYYLIKVDTRYTTSKIDQSFNFKVWINSDNDVLIKCSIPFGDSTTKNISISLNKNQIYNKIGDCYIMLNDSIWIDINEASAQTNSTSYYTVNQNGTYNVRVVSKSGNTLQSFIITKNEPLNAVAIIVIILSSAVVLTLVIIIIKLRKHMKVK